MTHEDAMNMILANACGLLTDEEEAENGGWNEYEIELHCIAYVVKAKHLGNLKFEIDWIERSSG